MAAATSDPLQRLEQALRAGPDTPRKRMLIIVNPYATTVSDRLKNLVVYALRGSFQVEAVETESRDHATRLPAAEHPHDAGMRDARLHLEAQGAQVLRDDFGRAGFAVGELGVGMDIAAPRQHLVADQGGAAVDFSVEAARLSVKRSNSENGQDGHER